VGVVVFVDKSEESLGLFEGVEILSLKVFHQRDFQGVLIGNSQFDTRNFRQPHLHGRMKATFSGNQLITTVASSDEQWFKDAVFFDAGHEIGQVSKVGTWLVVVAGEGRNANHSTDTLPHSLRQFIDKMPVVTHSFFGREADVFLIRIRHAGGPPRKGGSTRRLRWNVARGRKCSTDVRVPLRAEPIW